MATMISVVKLPLIYLISEGVMTDGNFVECSARFSELVSAAVKAEVSLVQIREKHLSASKVFELASRIAQITKNSQTLLLINDRADIALAAGADGVHLTANSLPVSVVRRTFPPNFIVGASTHSLAEVNQAAESGANFVTFSPIFATPSKANYDLPPHGLGKLQEVGKAVEDFPVIALGGIDETNFSAVLQAGARGIAAIRFLNDPQNLSKIVSKIRNDQ